MRSPLPGRVSAERGASTLLFALMLLFAIATLALGTDLARLFVERARLEQAAAMAARAAVEAAVDVRGNLHPEVAIANARASTRNLETAHPGHQGRTGARVAELVFPHPDLVTVTIRESLAPDGSPVVCIARMIGIRSLELRASGSASIPAVLDSVPAEVGHDPGPRRSSAPIN